MLPKRDILFFPLVALLGYTLFLGAVPLFDWDEINFAESAREMIVSGNYFQVQINFEPFWEKPPLFFWLQSWSMQLFGVTEFAARLPNALIGVVTVWYLYKIAHQWKGALFAQILAGLYMASFLPSIYFKSGIIDPVFNFFILVSLWQLFRYDIDFGHKNVTNRDFRPWAAGLFLGLATLTKGPACVLIAGLTYLIYKLIFDRNFPFKAIGQMILMFLLIVLGWYGIETMVHGFWFVEKFVAYQIRLFTQEDAGHGQPFYYHLLIFCFGCFPLSIFTFRGMFAQYEQKEDNLLKNFMKVWFWVVLILFSIAKTKIIHYSSLLYFPGVFLAALFVLESIKKDKKVTWDIYFLFILGMLLWGIAPTMINIVQQNLQTIINLLPAGRDKPFIVGMLSAPVQWSGFEWLIGAVFLLGLCVNVRFLIQKNYLRFIYVQLFLTLFLINAEYKWVLPKIATYTQGANVDFFKKAASQNAYCRSANYKSYTPFFYGQTQPSLKPEAQDLDWLCNGNVDKTVYLSVKNNLSEADFALKYKNFTRLYEAGGFVFLVREKVE
jgi:4-amino-4-deoxy-L-arabinose transferase-like glycosyltransferase